mmetsp:Transcript_8356/g.22240  ORF Transcript_8356/g.22240 Transcript_8356/m.22240 type:complete len:272 (+) Transcript_8356:308-1123(+)
MWNSTGVLCMSSGFSSSRVMGHMGFANDFPMPISVSSVSLKSLASTPSFSLTLATRVARFRSPPSVDVITSRYDCIVAPACLPQMPVPSTLNSPVPSPQTLRQLSSFTSLKPLGHLVRQYRPLVCFSSNSVPMSHMASVAPKATRRRCPGSHRKPTSESAEPNSSPSLSSKTSLSFSANSSSRKAPPAPSSPWSMAGTSSCSSSGAGCARAAPTDCTPDEGASGGHEGISGMSPSSWPWSRSSSSNSSSGPSSSSSESASMSSSSSSGCSG